MNRFHLYASVIFGLVSPCLAKLKYWAHGYPDDLRLFFEDLKLPNRIDELGLLLGSPVGRTNGAIGK